MKDYTEIIHNSSYKCPICNGFTIRAELDLCDLFDTDDCFSFDNCEGCPADNLKQCTCTNQELVAEIVRLRWLVDELLIEKLTIVDP